MNQYVVSVLLVVVATGYFVAGSQFATRKDLEDKLAFGKEMYEMGRERGRDEGRMEARRAP